MKGQSNTTETASSIPYQDSTVADKLDSLSTDVSNKVSDNLVFIEAQTRANIESGESFATILGKIKKWFSDLASMFVSKSGDTMSGNLYINRQDGTASAIGTSQINLGNSIAEGTNKNSYGRMAIFGKGSAFTFLQATNITANRVHELPDKNGTVALTSDTVKVQTLAVSQESNSISIHLTVENTNILNGIFFSRSWSEPSNPLKGSLYWISIRPSNNAVGFYALKEETVETGVKTAIDSATYDSTTQLLTITFKGSVQRFCEFIYY